MHEIRSREKILRSEENDFPASLAFWSWIFFQKHFLAWLWLRLCWRVLSWRLKLTLVGILWVQINVAQWFLCVWLILMVAAAAMNGLICFLMAAKKLWFFQRIATILAIIGIGMASTDWQGLIALSTKKWIWLVVAISMRWFPFDNWIHSVDQCLIQLVNGVMGYALNFLYLFVSINSLLITTS